MKIDARVAALPEWTGFAVRALPLPIISLVFGRLVAAMKCRHPELLERLGTHASTRFLIDPTDLPLLFLIRPDRANPIQCYRKLLRFDWDARVAGPLAALLAMVNGELDGDALFFSREVTIEGSTEAILALRNAIDAAEINLAADVIALCGPLKPLAADATRLLRPVLRRWSGVDQARQRIQTG